MPVWYITCDASDFAICVLQQCVDNIWQPLSFLSKKLSPAETQYSAFDQELLAVHATMRLFRHNLEGRDFLVNTDHKPLTYVMISTTKRPSLCLTSTWPISQSLQHISDTGKAEHCCGRHLGYWQCFSD